MLSPRIARFTFYSASPPGHIVAVVAFAPGHHSLTQITQDEESYPTVLPRVTQCHQYDGATAPRRDRIRLSRHTPRLDSECSTDL